MNTIKEAFHRNVKAMQARASIGKGTAITKIRVTDGLACSIEEGPWKLVTDMSPKSGGKGLGPNPGTLGRAALGSCLAVSYVQWAAVLDIPLISLEVEIQADYNSRGAYGWKEVSPAYSEIRYLVRVDSPAEEEEVLRLLDLAEQHTTYFHLFTHPQALKRRVELLASQNK